MLVASRWQRLYKNEMKLILAWSASSGFVRSKVIIASKPGTGTGSVSFVALVALMSDYEKAHAIIASVVQCTYLLGI